MEVRAWAVLEVFGGGGGVCASPCVLEPSKMAHNESYSKPPGSPLTTLIVVRYITPYKEFRRWLIREFLETMVFEGNPQSPVHIPGVPEPPVSKIPLLMMKLHMQSPKPILIRGLRTLAFSSRMGESYSTGSANPKP